MLKKDLKVLLSQRTPKAVHQMARRTAASLVADAKTQTHEKFKEAMEKELKYKNITFICCVWTELEMDQWIRVLLAVMRALLYMDVVKKKIKSKSKIVSGYHRYLKFYSSHV